jgi:hypothetical protein
MMQTEPALETWLRAFGAVCAVVGVAFRGEREFAESELSRFEIEVAAIGEVR